MSIRILRDVNTPFGDFAANDIVVGLSPSQEAALVNNNNAEAVLAAIGLGVPGSVIAPIAFSASLLLKTGLARVYSVVLSSGSGKVTVRNGTNVSGALVAGWGGGGASGLSIGAELTANVPYAPVLGPTSFDNGAYIEVSGTASGVVFVA